MIQKAVAAEPDNMAYRDSLGWVLFRLGRYAEAVAELEKAAAGKKPDAVVLDHLGDAYQKAGRRDKAVEAWRKRRRGVSRREKEDGEGGETVEKKDQDLVKIESGNGSSSSPKTKPKTCDSSTYCIVRSTVYR